MTRPITADEARAVLKAQQLARTTLTGYARYIDIPGVPESDDVDDRQYKVVETPLALHHIVMLNAMQLMAQGLLLYREPNVGAGFEGAVSWATLRGEPPRRGRAKGGVPDLQAHDPSANFEKIQISSNSALIPSRENSQPIYTEAIQTAFRGVLEGRIPPADALRLIHEESGAWAVCRRVMLMLPPGSAKSTYASVVFPTWVMGNTKAFETILTGWGDPICRRHGKRARQICSSPQYKALFGVEVDPNTRAAEDWQCTNFSSYKSSGITSGISGFRTHGLIWDDLIRNRKDADSPTIREDVWNEYTDSARSRKTPSAWEVGIGTRWHEDEHMGRILPEGYSGESGFIRCRDGNVWFVICMAAECERDDDPLGREVGQMIWEEWFTEDYWAEKRINMRSWASLYQQRPAPDEGLVFKREWFRRYRSRPEVSDIYISMDPGVSDVGDETAIQVWEVNEDAKLYLVDEFYRACTMDVWIEELILLVKRYRPIKVISEAGVIRRAAEPFLRRAMQNTKTFFATEWVNRSANKQAMAAGAMGMAAAGQVYLPEDTIGDNLIQDCLMFPASKKDHRVDAFVNLCLHLEQLFAAQVPVTHQEKPAIIGGEISIKSLMPERFPKKRSHWALR